MNDTSTDVFKRDHYRALLDILVKDIQKAMDKFDKEYKEASGGKISLKVGQDGKPPRTKKEPRSVQSYLDDLKS
jgi:hypothetical protein